MVVLHDPEYSEQGFKNVQIKFSVRLQKWI